MDKLIFHSKNKIYFLTLLPGMICRCGASHALCNVLFPAESGIDCEVFCDDNGKGTIRNFTPGSALQIAQELPDGAEELVPLWRLDFLPGQRLGDFHLVKKLFSGLRSSLYLAKKENDDARYAVKIYHARALDEGSGKEFLSAASRIRELDLPGIAPVVDAGIFGDTFPWIVTNYCPDPDLEFRISAKSPMAADEAVGIVCTLAFILGNALEQSSLFAGALEPDGILYKENKKLLVTGLGFFLWKSRVLCSGRPCISPLYASPEEIAGEEITWRTDQYTLGVMFFRMLTGMFPYHAETPEELYRMHLQGPFPLPACRNPEIKVPDRLSAALLRMTSRRPEDRFGSWDELRQALM